MFVVLKMTTAKAGGTTVLQVVTVAGTEHNVMNAPQLTKIRLAEDEREEPPCRVTMEWKK
jgi:hypothetical protein